MKTLREWARDHRLPLLEALHRYIAVRQFGKSRTDDGRKGFAVYGIPVDGNLKPAGQAIVVWVSDMRRDTAAEQEIASTATSGSNAPGADARMQRRPMNMVLRLVADPQMPKQAGTEFLAVMDITRANEMLDDFEGFRRELDAAQVQAQSQRPSYGKKGNARLIMPDDV